VIGQLGSIVDAIIRFYEILIVVYVLMSWFPVDRGGLYDIYRVLGSLAEPYVGIFRRIIPPLGGFDFSPMVALIVLDFVRVALSGLL
jgi:uncharacterized protein YggT (Ycf19 family)